MIDNLKTKKKLTIEAPRFTIDSTLNAGL